MIIKKVYPDLLMDIAGTRISSSLSDAALLKRLTGSPTRSPLSPDCYRPNSIYSPRRGGPDSTTEGLRGLGFFKFGDRDHGDSDCQTRVLPV
jgi:hypothetical protein